VEEIRFMDNLMDETPSTFIIGAIKPREHVENILKQLQTAGIPEKDISLVVPDDREGRDPADEKPRENADRVHDLTVGAAAGGIALGALGCLVGLASLAIPGLGLFIVAGPLAAVLSDVAVGGALGVVAGGLIGLRVPEHKAKAYEESLRTGSTIISIHTETADALRKARNVLTNAEAAEILEVMSDADMVPGEA
jgi:hypothetical protein